MAVNRPSDSAPSLRRSRRQWPRLLVENRLGARITGTEIDLDLRDLSAGGFSTEALFPFVQGESHEVLVTADTGWSASVRARVVHCRVVQDDARRDGTARYLVSWQYFTDRRTAQTVDRMINHVTGDLLVD